MSASINSGVAPNNNWLRPMWNHAPIEPGSLKTATVRPPDQGNAPLIGNVTGLGAGGGVGIGMNSDFSFGNVRLNVGLNPAASGSLTLAWPVAPPASANGVSFTADWATVTQSAPAGPTVDFDFTTGTIDPLIVWTRASAATDATFTDAPGATFNTYANNIPRNVPGKGLLIENASRNIFLNSEAPVTQTVTLNFTGFWVLWMTGTGSATIAAGTVVGTGFGVATNGVPVIVTVATAGTATVTLAGSVTRVQVEFNSGPYPTSYMQTAGAITLRSIDSGTYAAGAWLNQLEGTIAYDFVKLFNSGSFNCDMPSLFTDSNNIVLCRVAGVGGQSVGVIDFATGLSPSPVNASFIFANIVTNKFIAAYSTAGQTLRSTLNGASPVNSAAAAFFPAIAQFKFGAVRASNTAFDGYIKRLRYWPRAIGPIGLIDITAPTAPGLTLALNWTANRPLIPGEIVRLPYRWNTSN